MEVNYLDLNPFQKGNAQPERYYSEILERMKVGETIPHEEYAAFTTSPVIEVVQKAVIEERIIFAKYLYNHYHVDLEVRNLTMLPMNILIEVKENL